MKQNPKNAAATAAPHPAMPMRVRKLSHVVADALRSEIAAGQLNPGDQLMPEAELLQHFGVSRPTLREALRVVESEGLIQLGRGARTGATVLGPSIEIAARYGTMYLAVEKTTLGDVHQVRTLLEPSLARLLARQPSRQLVAALRGCAERERRSFDEADYVTTVSALNEFHRLMVQYSENRALRLLAGILEGIPARIYRRFLEVGSRADTRRFMQQTARSVEAHEKLVHLIAAHEDDRAEAFWRDYMGETAAYLKRTGMDRLRVQLAHAHG
ncbi:MAG: GntR family transcriptional regulator [Steroidobacteraceae bacterium]